MILTVKWTESHGPGAEGHVRRFLTPAVSLACISSRPPSSRSSLNLTCITVHAQRRQGKRQILQDHVVIGLLGRVRTGSHEFAQPRMHHGKTKYNNRRYMIPFFSLQFGSIRMN